MKGECLGNPKGSFPPPPPHVHKALPEEPASSLHQTAKKGTGFPLTAGCRPLVQAPLILSQGLSG